ncbi:hypothetical protein TIFTF001_040691 [Ficus carica]|uniref:Uncharacterized protein n=1 Tax=Ficus carica TaxID=3494 RepID=A0AA87ZFE6_FICCA|nr:hypothetical protein TIFTF001_040691 [Ficus carica]
MGGRISWVARSGELDGKRIVVARVYNYCPGLIVDKCGIRLLYQKDVEGLKKTITECCTSFVKDLESIDQFLESEDYGDLPSDDQTL